MPEKTGMTGAGGVPLSTVSQNASGWAIMLHEKQA